MRLFEYNEYDKQVYEEQIRDFLPAKIFDIHTHVDLRTIHVINLDQKIVGRTVTWPSKVAIDNPIEDLMETYRIMFPDKEATALIFSNRVHRGNVVESNDYIREASAKSGYPALYYSHPEQSAEELCEVITRDHFYGLKAYLDEAKKYIPVNEIRIYDFFPKEHLKLMNDLGLIVMLHIPRSGRFKDKVNLNQILEIKQDYPNIKLIIAHVGRAYSVKDIGEGPDNAFDILAKEDDLLFDITANTNTDVFTQLLDKVGPDRVLFGSDLPILRMRMRRIDEGGNYVNLVPPGIYDNIANDPHMREVSPEEAKKLTLFMYEEILAAKEACRRNGIGKDGAEKIFYSNAYNLINGIKEKRNYGK